MKELMRASFNLKKIFFYCLFLANLLIIFFFWGNYSGRLIWDSDPAGLFIALGRLTGLLAVYFVLLQLIFIGRVKWLEQVFGLDRLAKIHHLNGFLALVFIVSHPLFLTLGYSRFGQTGFLAQFYRFIFNGDELWQAFLALILFVALVFLSLVIVKKRLKYETWYFIHLLTYLAIILAFSHQLELGGDFSQGLFAGYWYLLYFFTFGHLLGYRFFKPLFNFYQHRFYVSKLEPETHEAVSVYLSGKNLADFKIKAGQFMILRFLSRGLWWQAHPFSLSCPINSQYLRVTIKQLGDFTSAVKEKLKAGSPVLIDGPYGVFTAERCFKNKVLLIAGGVGITPLRPLAEQLIAQGKDVVLLYANKTAKGVIFKKELEQLAFKDHFKVHYFLSQEPSALGRLVRLDGEIISRLVADFKEREIYLCGPLALMKDLIRALKKLGVRASSIHFEKFSLS